MKKIFLKNLGRVAAAVALAVSGSAAFAASTWSTNNLGSKCGDGTDGSTVNCGVQGGVTVSVTAWSNSLGTQAAGSFQTAAARNWGSNNGLGVCNDYEDCSTPQHTADNKNGTDFLLFQFSKDINVEDVTIGWWANDRDITVLAYKGETPNPSAPTVLGKTMSDFSASNGWVSVRDYGTPGTTSGTNTSGSSTDVHYATVDRDTFSSWWIVSAYNTEFGGGGNLGNTYDYVKVLSLSGSVYTPPPPSNGVPEPGSLALVGAAMMGFVASRRRKQQAA